MAKFSCWCDFPDYSSFYHEFSSRKSLRYYLANWTIIYNQWLYGACDEL